MVSQWLVEPLIEELRKAEAELAKRSDERMRELENENRMLKEHVDTLKKTVGIISNSK